MNETYFLVTGKKLIEFMADWRARSLSARIAASEYAKSKGADSYFSGWDDELYALPILDPVPEGWKTNKKLGRMLPAKGEAGDKARQEIANLAQPPKRQELSTIIKLPDRIYYETPNGSGSRAVGFRNNPLYSVRLGWTKNDFVLSVADPRPEIEQLKKENSKITIIQGEWKPPQGLKQISQAECEFIFAQAALEEEKEKNGKKCGHCKCGGKGGCHK